MTEPIQPFDAGEPIKPLVPPTLAADYEQWQLQQAKKNQASGRAPETTKPAASLVDEFKEMFKMTPEQEAEHERLIAERKALLDSEARKKALKEWTEVCPPRIQTNDWTFPALAPYKPKIQRALRWQYGAQGLYLVGGTGKGKTRALYWLARRLAVDELRVIRYLEQGQIMNEINRTSLDAWLEKVDRLKVAPILLWNDFGNFAAIRSRAEVLATELFDLIDYRYQYNLPMLISSNAREEDLAGIFGPMRAQPIYRRIQEGNTVLDFDK